MPIIYRTTPFDENYLSYMNKLWQDNWIYSGQLGDKLVFRKEEKKSRTQKITTWDDFHDFYRLYPHKKGKENARVMWSRLTEKERELAHAWLIRYIAYWKQKAIEKQFLPHPATWLHQKRWEDDLSDNIILTKPVDDIKKQIDEEKELEKERKWNMEQLVKLRSEWKYEEAYAKARDSLPEWQRKFEMIVRAKMIANIRNQ